MFGIIVRIIISLAGKHRSTDCMKTTDGKETILAHIMEYQRVLVGQRDPYFKEKKSKLYDVTRIEIHTNSALLSKEVEVGI